MKISQSIKKAASVVVATGLTLITTQVAMASLTDPNGDLYGSGTTSYSVENTSDSSATIVATYYNSDGTQALSQNLPTLASLGRTNVTVSTIGLPTQWTGNVVLSSDQDIVAAAVTMYTGKNTAADSSTSSPGTELSAYEAFNAGSTILYAPALFRVPAPPTDNVAAKQVTRFTIQNTTGSTANYTITYRARDGYLLGVYTGSLNGYGSKTFETKNDSDLPAGFISNLSGRGGGFSALIESDQPLAGVSESVANVASGTILNNWTGDHALITPASASTILYSPAAFRYCRNSATDLSNCAQYASISNYYSSFIQYSSFQLQNTTNSTANVTADFINRATGEISATLNFTIAAYSGYGINLFNGGSVALSDALFPALGGRFAGSVRFTSDQPLVGTGNIDFPYGAGTYGSYNLIGSADASNTIYAPLFSRVCASNTSTQCNANYLSNFDKVSVIQVMNVGNSAVTLTGIDLVRADGSISQTLTVKGDSTALTLQPGQAVGLNLYNGGDFLTSQFDSNIGYNFQGSLRVRGPSGALLKAIVEYRNGNLGMDQYNAFNR